MNTISFDSAVKYILDGGVGVIPTDTIYGIVASAHNKQAVERMYALKSRENKPGTLIASRIDDLYAIGVTQIEIDTVARLWPNPVSVVLPINGHDYLHQGVGSLAIRVTADPVLREFLDLTGPIITSSANHPGQPPATTVKEATRYFGDAVDFYVDGGTIADVPPSTIVRANGSELEILRQGSFTL